MLRCRVILFFISFIALQFNSYSQYFIKNYFSISGKKEVSFNCITQDNKGFLWIGTDEGIIKFDGKGSEYFRKEQGVNDSKITAIYADGDNTIWAGTENGNVYFIKKNKLVDSINFGKDKPQNKITSFYVSNNKKIFLSTYGDGLYIVEGDKIQHLKTDNGISDNVIYNMQYINRFLWCGTDAGITYISDVDGQHKLNIISNKDGLPDNIVRNISAFDGERMIVSMQDSGVCFLNLKSKEFERFPFFSNWTHGAVLNTIVIDQKNFAIATEKNDLFIIKNGRFFIQNYFSSFQTSSVNYLYKDYSNSLWLASPLGLHQCFEKRFDFINGSKGLTNEKILAIATDKNNCIWAGTEAGVQKIMKDSAGKMVFDQQAGLSKLTISSAAISPDGNIWFGTYSSGIEVLNPTTKKTHAFNSKNSKLPNDNISSLYFSKNSVFISSLGGGLIEADINCENGLTIKKIYTEADGLGSNYIYAAITDNADRLLAASDGGGLEILENGKFVSLTAKFKVESNTVFTLCKDSKGNIWATSNASGLLKYDGKTLKTFPQKNKIRDEQPQQLISYDNIVYAIHSKGIDKINSDNDSISYYDVFDGDLEPNLNSICIDNGILYSGTNNGVLTYRVAKQSSDTIKPNAQINRILVNYKGWPIDSINEFKHNQNNFSFDFNGIWLKAPDKLSFRFMLKGQEVDWNYSNEGKVVPYPNLEANTYTFVVQSKNEEDVWSNEATYTFTILLPIWKRWWFWVIVTIVAGSGIYLFIQYRIKALQKENLILEEKVNERTAEIEKQSKIIEDKSKELELLSLVASKTDNVVLILDAEGHYEYVNESYVRQHGNTLNDLKNKGQTIFELSNNPQIRQWVDDAIKNSRSVKYESLNQNSEGSEAWAASTLTPIFDENGTVKKIIIIDSDVTESKIQQKIIIQKNKDITDSLEYARKIQTAILPADKLIKKSLPESFVLYQTKDIVSGDFYWFTEKEDCCIIAAVDCTGHGVPGAFMSLIGYNILNQIVNELHITDPGEILKNLNKGVIEALYKNQSNSESKDGMDCAICKVYHNKKSIEYAGAMRPLWIVNGEEITEIKADKIPIGTLPNNPDEEITYTTTAIKARKGDMFYIFTDGYVDQFGGDRGKKFTSAKLKQFLISCNMLDCKTQYNLLYKEHVNWKGIQEQVDDILVIGFRPGTAVK